MSGDRLHAVTGAFGYSGKYIARRLLSEGRRVITLTNSPRRRNPFGDAVEVHPFRFDDPKRLAESLEGVSVLYNTYWVRFNHKTFTHADAVRNTKTLFDAADRLASSNAGLSGRMGPRGDRTRRGDHPRRDRRADGRPPLRRLSAGR
ncbi:MAG: NAD-dependent epimerase/dehydratase family protein, partial [Planctomycetota bacterium]